MIFKIILSLLTHIDTVLVQFYKDYCSRSFLYMMNKKSFFFLRHTEQIRCDPRLKVPLCLYLYVHSCL